MSLFKDICFKVETFLLDSYAGLFTRQDVNFFYYKTGICNYSYICSGLR